MDNNNKTIHQDIGLTIEQVRALYFDDKSIITQPEMIYRLDNGSNKFYYTFNFQEFKPEYYLSTTTLLQNTMPTPYAILEWYAKLGERGAEAKKQERQNYGLMMDIEFSNFLINKKCDLETLSDRVHAYCIQHKCDVSFVPEWTEELKKDLLSFNQWCMDYDVEPIAMQMMLVSREFGVVGILDLVCMKNEKLYTDKTADKDRKRVRALIDYKSGKSGQFYESNEIKLEIYKVCWNENFPEYPIGQLANYSGKDWLKTPSYNFKDQTVCNSHRKIGHLLEIASIDAYEPTRIIKVMGGQMSFKEMGDNCKAYNADEYIINIHRQQL